MLTLPIEIIENFLFFSNKFNPFNIEFFFLKGEVGCNNNKQLTFLKFFSYQFKACNTTFSEEALSEESFLVEAKEHLFDFVLQFFEFLSYQLR